MVLDYQTRQALIRKILNTDQGLSADDEAVRRQITLIIADEFAGSQLSLSERKEIVSELFNAMRGLDIIQPLMDDRRVTEIMVNGPYSIFYEMNGFLYASDLQFHDSSHLTGVITNFFGRANRMIHEKKPVADMRLVGGERVHAALPPVAPDGPVLTIRKFTGVRPDMDMLISCDFITQEAADFMINAIQTRQNIFICGGTGTGKTTFLNTLANFVGQSERVVTIEDASELSITGVVNLVRLEARPCGQDGDGEISVADLIKASLRMRPDRIIVGEVRGREAYDMLQAMNTGHPGSLCTGHGNSCHDMVDRLCLMVLTAVHLPWDAVRGLVASALDLIIHLNRAADGRRQVQEICAIQGCRSGQINLRRYFVREGSGELRHVSSI